MKSQTILSEISPDKNTGKPINFKKLIEFYEIVQSSVFDLSYLNLS